MNYEVQRLIRLAYDPETSIETATHLLGQVADIKARKWNPTRTTTIYHGIKKKR